MRVRAEVLLRDDDVREGRSLPIFTYLFQDRERVKLLFNGLLAPFICVNKGTEPDYKHDDGVAYNADG